MKYCNKSYKDSRRSMKHSKPYLIIKGKKIPKREERMLLKIPARRKSRRTILKKTQKKVVSRR